MERRRLADILATTAAYADACPIAPMLFGDEPSPLQLLPFRQPENGVHPFQAATTPTLLNLISAAPK